MNIFVLDSLPGVAAKYHCDKHVVKMCLESTQILCTVVQKQFQDSTLYKPTHRNHPCVKWAGESKANFMWLVNLTGALFDEYTYRYGKFHKSSTVFGKALTYIDKLVYTENKLTDFALAMPEQYRSENPIESYRNYYIGEKARMLKYTKREAPKWLEQKMLKSKLNIL